MADAPVRRSEAGAAGGDPSGRHAGKRVQQGVTSVLAALGWSIMGLLSLAAWVLALWVVMALARIADGDDVNLWWAWTIAFAVTLGAPFLLATWKHRGDGTEIRATMTWLPFVWNAAGLLLASQLVPDMIGAALRKQGAWMVANKLGNSHSTTRVLSALGHRAAEVVDPRGDLPSSLEVEPAALPVPVPPDSTVDRSSAVTVPFGDEGTAIVMDTTLVGPAGTVTVPYLFDTGASFTTISSSTAAKLGIDVPPDAPNLKFNTASGPRESRMVYLPALRLADAEIPSLLVSVCDTCVNERTGGLLGLNVVREFFIEMDYKNQRMTLLPRLATGRPNRSYDIEPVVDIRVEGSPEVWLGRVHWVLLVTNRGRIPVEGVVPVVRFDGGPRLIGRTIARILPGQTERSLVEGAAHLGDEGDSAGLFTLTLQEAFW